MNCEINEDDCASNPCVHGECQDGISEYTCVCSPGYTGMVLICTSVKLMILNISQIKSYNIM